MQINIYKINQIIWETKNKEKNILTYKIINSLTWKILNEMCMYSTAQSIVDYRMWL
jgi:hypothetical protein